MTTAVFGDYAAYYNLLYKDKDYKGEVDYVETLIRQARPVLDKCRILDVGCGTVRHSAVLAGRGHAVTGIDASEEMVRLARLGGGGTTRYLVADARRFRLEESFDVAISLFHVASYQTSNADLLGYFRSVADHLHPAGLFIFDCWYGPAVLHQMPGIRVKELEDDTLRIVRIARPTLEPEDDCVLVAFDLLLEKKVDGSLHRLREEHRMRYLFLPEIRGFLDSAGLQLLRSEEWMTGGRLGVETWSACFVAGKP